MNPDFHQILTQDMGKFQPHHLHESSTNIGFNQILTHSLIELQYQHHLIESSTNIEFHQILSSDQNIFQHHHQLLESSTNLEFHQILTHDLMGFQQYYDLFEPSSLIPSTSSSNRMINECWTSTCTLSRFEWIPTSLSPRIIHKDDIASDTHSPHDKAIRWSVVFRFSVVVQKSIFFAEFEIHQIELTNRNNTMNWCFGICFAWVSRVETLNERKLNERKRVKNWK